MNDKGHRFGHGSGLNLRLAAWMHSRRRKLLAAAAAGLSSAMVLLAGCGPVKLVAKTNIPPPLVMKVPIGVALFVPTEFSNYIHKEERWSTKWHIELGKAQTDSITRLMGAMFERVVPVESVNSGTQVPGGVAAILEPSIEEYAFVTPRDAGSPFYAVSIKYRVNVYLPDGKLADSWGFTGYGTAPSQGLSSEAPLHAATASAMRDAGAKLAVEFREQAVMRGLVPGAPTADAPAAAATPAGPGAATAPAAPGTEKPSTATPSTEAPGTATPGTEAPGTSTPGNATPGTATPGTDAPGTAMPGTEEPSTPTPSDEASGAAAPSTEKPSTEAPSAATPGSKAPGTGPGTAVPPTPPVAAPKENEDAAKDHADGEPPQQGEKPENEQPAEDAAAEPQQTPQVDQPKDEQADGQPDGEEGEQPTEQGTDKKIPKQPGAPEAFALARAVR